MGLVAVAKKKFKVTTDSEHNLPVYKNILSRNFPQQPSIKNGLVILPMSTPKKDSYILP